MQDSLLHPWRPRTMQLSGFLAALFQALEREGVSPCVLRNYEGFPSVNLGSDVDLLILPSQLPRAVHALQSIPGVRIVGYLERHYVANVYIEGVSPAPGIRALHIDFNLSLAWKDLPYLATQAVLESAIPRQADNLNFLVPSPVHEAIVSLLASLLAGGQVKEKYFPQVQRTFASNRPEAINVLSHPFALTLASRLVDAVIDGDRRKVLRCVGPLRASLAWCSLLHGPVRSISAIARHYTREVAVRFSPQNLETVCLVGPDERTKSAIIEDLAPLLRFAAQVVEKRPSGARTAFTDSSSGTIARAGSHGENPKGSFAAIATAVLCMLKEWRSLFQKKLNLTLRICASCGRDLLIDPLRCRDGGRAWLIVLVRRFLLPPDLWILLDGRADASEFHGQQLLSEKSLGQLQAYRSYVKAIGRLVILDTSKPIACVTEDAYEAIIDTLARRTERILEKRF